MNFKSIPGSRRLWLVASALLIPVIAYALLQAPAFRGSAATVADAITGLEQKIESGDVKLQFDKDHGYLKSLLQTLNIPVSSQTLVFAKNSFQLHLISPDTPRAMYFNDDVYVTWVRGGEDIEVTAVDPKQGPVFYMLAQENGLKPKFRKETVNCTACHDFFQTTTPIPRLLMLSVLPDPAGSAIGAAALVTNDQSPLNERWGGWYVTGTHGNQRHLGNLTFNERASTKINIKEYVAKADLSGGANVTNLSGRFDTSPFLTPHSDVVALMVLGHQTHVHNLITLASHQTLEKEASEGSVADAAESLVRSLLFSRAAPLTGRVAGTTDFAAEFSKLGPRDSRGRSLRDLDLETRLLRYPLSYVIYSKAFDEMPAKLKQYVYRRMQEVLNGEDKSEDFAHLSAADRQAVLEILTETKPDFVKK